MKDKKEAIILLAHGSPERFARKNILSLKKKLSCKFNNKKHIFYHAFLQFNSPRLTECLYGIGRAKKSLIRKITILPVFISDGSHTVHDMPSIIRTFRKTYKHINIKLAKPLRNDDLVVRLLYKRYRASLYGT